MPLTDTNDWQWVGPAGVIANLAKLTLRNSYYGKHLRYGLRQYGVNLDFVRLRPDPANIQIRTQSGGPLRFGEPVAIRIDGDSWLRYGERSFGVNLRWSSSPQYEWQITGGTSGTNVTTGTNVGLFNSKENDHLVGSWRTYGINLAWAKMVNVGANGERRLPRTGWSSFWSDVTGVVEAVGDAAVSVVSAGATIVDAVSAPFLGAAAVVVDVIEAFPVVGRLVEWVRNAILTLAWGLASIGDFVLTLLGIKIEKRLRVRVLIQRDDQGNPVATATQILPQLQMAMDTFKRVANVRLIPVDIGFHHAFEGRPTANDKMFIETLDGPSYENTLDVACDADGFARDLLTTTGSAFKLMIARQWLSAGRRLLGYGAPVFVFAVRSVSHGYAGCSCGPLTDFVVVDFARPFPTTTAHELGHACNLFDVSDSESLMYHPQNRGASLDRFQVALLRASRHVTFF